MELHRRRSPGRERAGRLAARQPESVELPVHVESQQRPDSGRSTKWAEHSGRVPTAGAEGRVVDAYADPSRDFESKRDRFEKLAARSVLLLGNSQGRWNHFWSDMAQRRPVDVARGYRGDEVAIEKRRTHRGQ